MREVVLDVETTGLEAGGGDRIVEVGCVEIQDGARTGESFQAYINPEMPMPEGARRIHGLDDVFLADKPVFGEVVEGLLVFLGDAPLVIHNAPFDMGFLRAELKRLGRPALPNEIIDTLEMARAEGGRGGNSLDALAKRFSIHAQREKHGALLDAHILAQVYQRMRWGDAQASFALNEKKEREAMQTLPVRGVRALTVDDEARRAHAAYVQQGLRAPSLWEKKKLL